MKLVMGAKIKYSTLGGTGITGNFGIDIPPLGVTIGPKSHWSRTNDAQTELDRDSEIVFAFRVKRLRLGRKVKTEEYNKGAFLTIGKDGNDDETESVLVDDVDGPDIIQDSTEVMRIEQV